ncbi:MAG: acyl-CoA thioesterase [Bacteroidales bacterium]|nr:acyl-CoA thioesterase [Bacteroidales bacterium]MDD4671001.1 acyl-CoA thioesterase [Bacteroidales bacterium]
MSENKILTATKEIDVRFSEVDSMAIVWHGSYVLYFEDARESFGLKYGLDYLTIFGNGYYAPLVDMHFEFKSPLIYGKKAVIEIAYRPCSAAKIQFDYKIFGAEHNELIATGYTTQVFLDKEYKLALYNPDFYEQWKKKMDV